MGETRCSCSFRFVVISRLVVTVPEGVLLVRGESRATGKSRSQIDPHAAVFADPLAMSLLNQGIPTLHLGIQSLRRIQLLRSLPPARKRPLWRDRAVQSAPKCVVIC